MSERRFEINTVYRAPTPVEYQKPKRYCVDCFHIEACRHLDLEGAMFEMDVNHCPYYFEPPSPEKFKEQMLELAVRDDVEVRHTSMDKLVLELLSQFGYQEAVDIFERTEKWYG